MYKYRPRRGSLDRWGRRPAFLFIQNRRETQPLQARIRSQTTSSVSGSQSRPQGGKAGRDPGVWLQESSSHPGPSTMRQKNKVF